MLIGTVAFLMVLSSDHGKLKQERDDNPELLVCRAAYVELDPDPHIPLLARRAVNGDQPPMYDATYQTDKRANVYV